MVKLFLDPGHGGQDPGAVANGLKEKDLTLDIVLKINELLKQYEGVETKLSRDSDKTVSLSERTNMANRWGADYLLSVHINAGGGTGYEDYIHDSLSHTTKTSKLRTIIHNEIVDELGVKNRGKKKANFHMLRESFMSALLTENLFIDHDSDSKKLKDSKWLYKIAQGHVNGLVKAFDLKKKHKNGSCYKQYKIVKGDTLSHIAKRYKTTVDELMRINPEIKNKNKIYINQVINIPK